MHNLLSLFFALLLMLSAFLLFSIQLIFSKMVLPILGGSPQVWTTCMLFFQVMLLAGYGYAHWISTKTPSRIQIPLHLFFLALGTAFIPLNITQSMNQDSVYHPAYWLLKIAFSKIGWPFFILSASAPLLQFWFSRLKSSEGKNPYLLYAASNLGSFLGLFLYPVFIEPRFNLGTQTLAWSATYVCLLILLCGILFLPKSTSNNLLNKNATSHHPHLSLKLRIQWIVLAFIPVSLMLGTTTYITLDLAPFPLLWVLPLSIYLTTFILAFSNSSETHLKITQRIIPHILTLFILIVSVKANQPYPLILGLALLTLAVVALYFHCFLWKLKPDTSYLTQFYLCLSLGGALAGCFNSMIAPLIFKSVLEYPIALVLAAYFYRSSTISSQGRITKTKITTLFLLQILFYSMSRWMPDALISQNLILKIIYILPPALILFSLRHRPILFAWFTIFILLIWRLPIDKQNQIYESRSFFGTHIVRRDSKMTKYTNGVITHGAQMTDPARMHEPAAYFHRSGPLGDLFANLSDLWANSHIGVTGLGMGTLAAYSESGQKWFYFEIDPEVKHIAENPKLFSYLQQSKAPYQIILGDGRLSLLAFPDHDFKLLILDAFSSDSIPVHLLTREAFQLYLKKLDPQGVLIAQISNLNMNLEPVMASMAKTSKLKAWGRYDGADENPQDPKTLGKFASQWVIMSQNPIVINRMESLTQWHPLPLNVPHQFHWTDDYSNILSVIRWPHFKKLAVTNKESSK